MPRIIVTQFDPEESHSNTYSSFSSAGIPIKHLSPPLDTYLPQISDKSFQREQEGDAGSIAKEDKIWPC